MDVKYFIDMTNLKVISFSGTASGHGVVAKKDGKFDLRAALNVKNFALNDALMGDADIRAAWNAEKKSIDLGADIVEEGIGKTVVKGYVSPPNKDMELNIESKNTNIGLLNRYTAGIFSDLEGRTTGRLRLFGKFRELDFEGDELVDAKAKVVYTGVDYNIKGARLIVKPGRFEFHNVGVTDNYRGMGRVNGYLAHKYLKNLTYHFDMTCNDMLCYDLPKGVGDLFGATAYGTGSITMDGSPGRFQADIYLTPEQGTSFLYSLDSPAALSDGKLLAFGKSRYDLKKDVADNQIQPEVPLSSTDVRLNMHFNTNPNAKIRIIMDAKTDDDLNVTGSGDIKAEYYNKGAFKLHGTYTVEEGNYKLRIQNIFLKNFAIQKGSSMSFIGDPLNSNVNLTAHYTVPSVSLADLNMGDALTQTSVPVNCVLKLDGKVNAPKISFDLDVLKVNDVEKQMVRQFINSEGNMGMQVFCLLGYGKFFTNDYKSSEMSQRGYSQSTTMVNSLLSGTLSSQINDVLSRAMGTSDWSFGTNLSTGVEGWNDMEVGGSVSGRLFKGRLLLNGSFGYRDRTDYTSNSNNFIGDFDVRYLLTPSGSVSMKAYSETNDRYFTKSSLTTQGVGLQLSRDFSSLRDLFKSTYKRKKKAKKNSEVQE